MLALLLLLTNTLIADDETITSDVPDPIVIPVGPPSFKVLMGLGRNTDNESALHEEKVELEPVSPYRFISVEEIHPFDTSGRSCWMKYDAPGDRLGWNVVGLDATSVVIIEGKLGALGPGAPADFKVKTARINLRVGYNTVREVSEANETMGPAFDPDSFSGLVCRPADAPLLCKVETQNLDDTPGLKQVHVTGGPFKYKATNTGTIDDAASYIALPNTGGTFYLWPDPSNPNCFGNITATYTGSTDGGDVQDLVPCYLDDGSTLVAITAEDDAASEEGPDTGKFLISRLGSVSSPLDVHFTISGTAQNGRDYNTISSPVSIPSSQSSVCINILPITGDENNEPDETIEITINTDPLNPDNYTFISDSMISAVVNLTEVK